MSDQIAEPEATEEVTPEELAAIEADAQYDPEVEGIEVEEVQE